MGNGNVRQVTIKRNELMELSKITSFSTEVISTIHSYFLFFSSLIKDDGVIDFNEFLSITNLEDNLFSRKLYNAFDINKDSKINFREFIKFFSCFANGNLDSQCELSYKLFCDEKTKTIEKATMKEILISAINANNILSAYIDNKMIDTIINQTYECAGLCDESLISEDKLDQRVMNKGMASISTPVYASNDNGQSSLSYEKYCEMVNANPAIISWLQVNITKLKESGRVHRPKCCI